MQDEYAISNHEQMTIEEENVLFEEVVQAATYKRNE